MSSLLSIQGLSVRYGPTPAVSDLSLEVEAGELVSVIGPNGAGKSTTLATVAGLIKPEAGDVTFDGRSIVGEPPEQIARRGVSLVPEGRGIFHSLTVYENLVVGATPRPDVRDVAEDIEHIVGLFPILGTSRATPAGKLSGGEQQQLAIARALLAKPRLLLLDEPSLGLAPRTADVVFDRLARLREEGLTLLLIEQNAGRAVAIADRTYVLRGGRVAFSGRREDFAEHRQLVEAYLGR